MMTIILTTVIVTAFWIYIIQRVKKSIADDCKAEVYIYKKGNEITDVEVMNGNFEVKEIKKNGENVIEDCETYGRDKVIKEIKGDI